MTSSSPSRSLPYNDDVSMEMIVDDIVMRINDVMNRTAVGDDVDDDIKKAHIKNLQKKVRSLKEQLILKETQSEMLKEKVRVMEDRMMHLEMKLSNDDDVTRNDKLAKIIEKYRIELNEAHLELRQLRSRVVETTNLKTDSLEREEEIKRLEMRLRQQENRNRKQQQQIDDRLLFELRQLLSRMLGISYDTSVAVDFEIISRLEKLIVATYNNPELMSNSFVIDPSNSIGLAEEFRRGYNSVMDEQPANHRPRSYRVGHVNSSGYGRMNEVKSRSRSLSPHKKIDPNVY
ncbi:hypothetical protein HELRODRAFT_179584 [Helobdella robusta]|uniref:Uncharacterized protein n=1 Tax=Helobdella robusta TaxID=6412 RepID=T1FEW6_HELRO|nr:hypothetical protein HELRODRAFT_179584 [Helobdella robusta]ESN95247.1 hypothetical protein HELRODRAFT_179584 [Helobdella robusta]